MATEIDLSGDGGVLKEILKVSNFINFHVSWNKIDIDYK